MDCFFTIALKPIEIPRILMVIIIVQAQTCLCATKFHYRFLGKFKGQVKFPRKFLSVLRY